MEVNDSLRDAYLFYTEDCTPPGSRLANPATATETPKAESLIKMYPNPSKGNVIIELLGEIDASSISIVNATGVIIRNEKLVSNRNEVNLTNLKSGLYIIRIFDSNGQFIESKKLSLINE